MKPSVLSIGKTFEAYGIKLNDSLIGPCVPDDWEESGTAWENEHYKYWGGHITNSLVSIKNRGCEQYLIDYCGFTDDEIEIARGIGGIAAVYARRSYQMCLAEKMGEETIEFAP